MCSKQVAGKIAFNLRRYVVWNSQRDNFTSLLFAWKIFKKSRRESFTSNIVINPRNYVVSRVLFLFNMLEITAVAGT